MAVVGDKERNKVLDVIKQLVNSNDGQWIGHVAEITKKCKLHPRIVNGAIFDLHESVVIRRFQYDDGRMILTIVK